jgi:membrane-bound inhibitor of C-type lysozyme
MRGLLLAAVAALSGCAPSIHEPVLPARIDYVCPGNQVLPVARNGQVAAVRVNGQEITLSRTESAAQEKYVLGGLALYLDGERAMLEQDGRVLLGPCNSPATLPTAPAVRPVR